MAAESWRLEETRPGDAVAIQNLQRRCYLACDVFKMYQLRHILHSPTCRGLAIRGPDHTVLGNVLGLMRRFVIPSGRIYNIVVAPELQGRGAASQLLLAMEAIFVAAGMRDSYAEIRQSNAASRALFARNGYREIGPLPRYYPDGEDGVKVLKNLTGAGATPNSIRCK